MKLVVRSTRKARIETENQKSQRRPLDIGTSAYPGEIPCLMTILQIFEILLFSGGEDDNIIQLIVQVSLIKLTEQMRNTP